MFWNNGVSATSIDNKITCSAIDNCKNLNHVAEFRKANN